jgi:hypothetical protein
LDKTIVTGWTAKKNLEIFRELLPDMSIMHSKIRIEARSKLPKDFSFEVSNTGRAPLQYVLDAITAVWTDLEWIHLPVKKIQESMERVFAFVVSRHVPAMFESFNIRDGRRLENESRDFVAMTLMNFGYTSVRSNRLFCKTYTWNGRGPRPLNWFIYYSWVHYFDSNDDDDEREFVAPELIPPIRQVSEPIRMGLTTCEWYDRLNDTNADEEEICFDLFGNYTVCLSMDNMDAGFFNRFLHRTRQGRLMPVDEGGYGTDGDDGYIPNDPNYGYRGGYNGLLDTILQTVRFFPHRHGLGQSYTARFLRGEVAAHGERPVDVAASIIEQMHGSNDRAERYQDLEKNNDLDITPSPTMG